MQLQRTSTVLLAVFAFLAASTCFAEIVPFSAGDNIISFSLTATARSGYATDTNNFFGEGAGVDLGGQAMIVNISWDATYIDANCNTGCSKTSPQFITETVSVGGNLRTIPTQDDLGNNTPSVFICYTCSRSQGLVGITGPYGWSFLTSGYHAINTNGLTQDPHPVDSESAVLALLGADQYYGDGFTVGVGNSAATLVQLQGTINSGSSSIVDTSAPEPSTWLMFGTGLAVAGLFRKKLAV